MNRMNTGRIPKQILFYQLRGHPTKKWEENMKA